MRTSDPIITESLATTTARLTRLGILTRIVIWHTTSTALVRLYKAIVKIKFYELVYTPNWESHITDKCVWLAYLGGHMDLADWIEVAIIVTYSGYYLLWFPEARNWALDRILSLICASPSVEELLNRNKLSLSTEPPSAHQAAKFRHRREVFNSKSYLTLRSLISEMPRNYGRNAIKWLRKRKDLPKDVQLFRERYKNF
ncbi:hypothetical protein D915_007509 [Fasciola hepatica]|uniref:Uncharacterized protein n=1 Tax=Fasciola hepatica TaxID=6192 RepID=A0A4E0R5F8_FASHE|nr:hypothetical protein D915_007509 [Fasciola hepatica]